MLPFSYNKSPAKVTATAMRFRQFMRCLPAFASTVWLLVAVGAFGQDPRLGEPLQRSQPPAAKTSELEYRAADAYGWIDTARRLGVKQFYNTILLPTQYVPIAWTGDVVAGIPGTTSQAFRDAAATRVNWFRAMAGVPPVITFDPVKNGKAQQAALMMSVNRALSHTPPDTWTHYTAEGAEAAGNSNLCLSSGTLDPGCVSLYMDDSGANNGAVGHRRWILYPQTRVMGTGDIPKTGTWPDYYPAANALWVFDSHMWEPRPTTRDGFVAWPPPGYVPHNLFYGRWSFSYPGADFSGSSVTLTRGGVSVPTQLEQVRNGYGENTLVWVVDSQDLPQSPPAVDIIYSVTVHNVVLNGVGQDHSYQTVAFDPGGPMPADKIAVLLNGYWTIDKNGNGFWDEGTDQSFSFGWEGVTAMTGDWNGDGHETAGVFDNGVWYLDVDGNGLWDGGVTDRKHSFGWAGVTPVVGDWNGDFADEIGVFSDGFWVLDMDGNGFYTAASDRFFNWGWTGVEPVVGDWNGNGADSVGIFSDGFWYLDMDGNTVWDGGTDRLIPLGWNGATVVIGDWNGDLADDVGVFSDGFWFLDYNGNGVWEGAETDRLFNWGWPGARPVVGDWNGNGSDSVGIFSDGFWFLDVNGDTVWNGEPTDAQYFWGSANAVPVVGAW